MLGVVSRCVAEGRECMVFEMGENLDLGDLGIPTEPVWTISAKHYTPEGDIEFLGLVGRVSDPTEARGTIEGWLRDRDLIGDAGLVLGWGLRDEHGTDLDEEA